ncbi:MAG TPA: 1-acyl-sn-glycerol-3-phosphate acyltransferase [Acidimicrobiales bacterium]|nr:1-acyl-sn-glycerol-3-phosphate acyltransferase [Acidimicrobiales bacterium]
MRAAAVFDLDRTLIAGSAVPIALRHLHAAGLPVPTLPAEGALQGVVGLVGDALPGATALQVLAEPTAGWATVDVEEAARHLAEEVATRLHPFVGGVLDEHRRAGRLVVLACALGAPLARAIGERIGADDIVATEWEVADGRTTGRRLGPRIAGRAKRAEVAAWAGRAGVDLTGSWVYASSHRDTGLLGLAGHPVVVNPDPRLAATAVLRRWPMRWLDKPEGVVKVAGREVQDWVRPLSAPALDPFAHVVLEGVERVPPAGGAVLVFNHRSYYDATAVAYLIAASGRRARFLGKKEVFDVPVAGSVGKALGGIRVDRGTGSDEPLDRAVAALVGGDLIAMAPQGTIPRGPAFFEPELQGRWGAARLAIATGVPVVPVGLWGTEQVWPRSARVPRPVRPGGVRPTVRVHVGEPFRVGGDDPDVATKEIMHRITALLPAEAQRRRTPTAEELRATYPPGYRGDPAAERARRPGRDT